MEQEAFEGPGPEVFFRERLAAGELVLRHCRSCDACAAQPVVLCPTCGEPTLEWRPAKGRGVVYAATVVRSGPGRESPYSVVLVDLEEGPRLMSRVEGMPPEEVRIGMPVTLDVVVPSDGKAFHVFRPAEAAQ